MAKHTTFLKDIRTHDTAWLKAEITKRHETLRALRFEIGFGTVSSLSQFRAAKRELAQLWTVLGEHLSQADQSTAPALPTGKQRPQKTR